jgi:hypothetical protein
MLKKERILHRFFYLEFNPTVLEERKARREWLKRDRGTSLTSGLRDPKEEPVEEMTLDLEDRRYNFYLRPLGGGV